MALTLKRLHKIAQEWVNEAADPWQAAERENKSSQFLTYVAKKVDL